DGAAASCDGQEPREVTQGALADARAPFFWPVQPRWSLGGCIGWYPWRGAGALKENIMSEAKKPRLVVVMEGGIIHGLVADAPIEVAVVDYDAEGAEPDFVSQVAQLDTDGSVSGYEDAVVSLPHVEVETPGN